MRLPSIYAFLCLISTIASAQTHISTNLKTEFGWDKINKEWKFESQDEESSTFFKFNRDFTMLKHTTPTITSAYIIQSFTHDEVEGRDQYVCMITSDEGETYIMVVDLKNDNVRLITNDLKIMTQYRIKATWTND